MLKRWDELTHSSKKAYEFRLQYIMAPFQRLAARTPWFNKKSVQEYSKQLGRTYHLWLDRATILDVGCGPGNLSEYFINDCKAKGYVGVDYSPGMIKDALLKYSDEIFLIGDATALPFKDASFDVVHSTRLIHHIPPEIRNKAISEQLRIARRAVIIEDLFGFEPGIWRYPHMIYYKIADGSYYRYTMKEWQSMLESLTVNCKVKEHFHTDERMILGKFACWVIIP